MEKEILIIDDGTKDYAFQNNKGEIFAEFSFNPADTGIVERFKGVVDFFQTYDYSIKGDTLEFIEKFSAEIKEKYALLLGGNADGLFMKYSPMSIMGNGDFYAEVILEQVGSIIEKEMDVKFAEKKAKIQKATAKYTK